LPDPQPGLILARSFRIRSSTLTPAAKNAEEFWLSDYGWGVAKNVQYGEPEKTTKPLFGGASSL